VQRQRRPLGIVLSKYTLDSHGGAANKALASHALRAGRLPPSFRNHSQSGIGFALTLRW
jgi:hypothetical protein